MRIRCKDAFTVKSHFDFRLRLHFVRAARRFYSVPSKGFCHLYCGTFTITRYIHRYTGLLTSA